MIAKTVAEMSAEDLRVLIEGAVERKLVELLGDPDEGLVLQDAIRERLLVQTREVASGDRGRDFDEVVRELGLA